MRASQPICSRDDILIWPDDMWGYREDYSENEVAWRDYRTLHADTEAWEKFLADLERD